MSKAEIATNKIRVIITIEDYTLRVSRRITQKLIENYSERNGNEIYHNRQISHIINAWSKDMMMNKKSKVKKWMKHKKT